MKPILHSICFLIGITIIFFSCKEKPASSQDNSIVENTTTINDRKAADLEAKMMTAMGGKEKWDDLKYVSWTFFGARHLIWDKRGGRVRIDSPRDTSIYLIDLNHETGKVIQGGQEITDATKLSQWVKKGKSIWINDSYWLFMPLKLRDPGVTVQYLREDTIPGGLPADVLQLTFEDVGNTPENKYEVYIDRKDNLIKQWAFFKEANQTEPPRVWPWDNYKDYDGLLLSAERSDNSGPSNVRVYESLPESVFTSFEPYDYF